MNGHCKRTSLWTTALKIALTIAGHDPSSGAGITADLAVFAAHGLFGTSCITALTVQSTMGVRATQPMSGELITDVLSCLTGDMEPSGVKVGMLATAPVIVAIAAFLAELRRSSSRIPVVLDPVLRSSSGRELLTSRGLEVLKTELLPLVNWITPNLDELGLLSGHEVMSREQMPDAAEALRQRYPELNVLATGGHLERPDDLLLTAAGDQDWLPGEHIESTGTHGTGCALSSALLANLVRGEQPLGASWRAKQYVAAAIRSAPQLGHGRGPLNLTLAPER